MAEGMENERAYIPESVLGVISGLKAGGFEAYVVGGCVRDLILERVPKDWDVATDAKPDEVKGIFPDSVYENQFGTVGVKVRNGEIRKEAPFEEDSADGLPADKDAVEIIEVTTYRIESKYSDKRRPDEVKFAKTLEEDLSRRDFTINAMAFDPTVSESKALSKEPKENKTITIGGKQYAVIDFFGGLQDIRQKTIRAVGNAHERFDEDALRMMRAIRFSVQLGFEIEKGTLLAIRNNSKHIVHVSYERIQDEFSKIILSDAPARGVELLHEAGILDVIIPEIGAGYDVTQSHHHYYGPYNTVYKHLLASLEKCPSEKLEVRLAAMLHDIGKPKSKRGEGENATFYNHEHIGARMARNILERLKYSRKIIDKVELLVKNHMFYYNVDEVGESGVRRVVKKAGLENIKDLIDVRIADRLGSGVPKAVPYKLRHFRFMVDKVSNDPISAKQLRINGNDLMRELGIEPGPKIGAILDVLLARVIDDPALNEKEKLLNLAKELARNNPEQLREMAKEKIEEEREKEEKNIKKRYHVG
ncbi:MAG: CCA tRNA nucleotidyltransferase [Candidatus Moranbacteria bacterium]|nr:CCA tRNA nucleotidyltransferase [Candidatus Moranbacteria bacterium]